MSPNTRFEFDESATRRASCWCRGSEPIAVPKRWEIDARKGVAAIALIDAPHGSDLYFRGRNLLIFTDDVEEPIPLHEVQSTNRVVSADAPPLGEMWSNAYPYRSRNQIIHYGPENQKP